MGRWRNPQNPACPRCVAAETVSAGRENGRPRWRCLNCGRSFGQTLGTPLYRLKTAAAEIVRALQVVVHRGSLRAAEEQTGHNDETVATWLRRIGDRAEAITDLLARDLHLSEVEVDELWSFVGQKGHQTSAEQNDPLPADGPGERWGSMTIDRGVPPLGPASWWPGPVGRVRRLCSLAGGRDHPPANKGADRHRLRQRRVEAIRGDDQNHLSRSGTVRDSPRLGHPAADRRDPSDPSGETPAREAAGAGGSASDHRRPGRPALPGPHRAAQRVLRDRLGCLTRKTHAFAKRIALWDALFSLALFEQNWLRPHIALRVPLTVSVNGHRYDRRTPVMAIGLTNHPWTGTEFLIKRGKAH